jgi:hypothetical protein
MPSHTLPRRTTLRAYAQNADWNRFSTAVSLHAHTSYSREVMSDLPRYIAKIPLVAGRFARSSAGIDFSKGWWHPPISARGVFESEVAQIERRFGLESIVSLTDHDDIAAGLDVQRLYAATRAPISFEWTVPWEGGFFHFGVHNLPPASAREWFSRLSAFTSHPRPGELDDILDNLNAVPGLLLVFNHPMWDLACVGDAVHLQALHRFMHAHGPMVHALEINGYRSRRENARVREMAATLDIPLISGGDRHAIAPNAVVNLTAARTFAEFADEIRDGESHLVVMPEYSQPTELRKLAAAADVVRHYRNYPQERRHWTGRVSWLREDGVRPLSHILPGGGPLWLRSVITAFRFAGSPVSRALLTPVFRRRPANLDPGLLPTLS